MTKRTINEIYEIIKEEIEKTKKKLQNVKVFHYSLDGSLVAGEYFESEKGIHYYERIKAFEEVISLMKNGGVLEDEKVKERALELACRRIDYLMGEEDSEYVTDPFTFELLAKEELDKGEE